jgi:hypothetical protein
MPPELASHKFWQRSVSSGLHALFFLTGVKGSTELTAADAAKRTMKVDLRWST